MTSQYLLSILFIISTHFVIFGQAKQPFDFYKKLNNNLNDLEDFKDNDAMLQLKLEHLEYINQSRKKYKVQPLQLDILASRVANKMAHEAATKNFMGHYNTNGEKPYHRYAFAGGKDHVTENAGAVSYTGSFNASNQNISNTSKQIHDAFMAEKAPNDGHKQNCINPHHNFIGIGIGWSDKEFRYYEEYIDRYLIFNNIETSTKRNNTITIAIKPISENQHVYAAIAYHEPFLKKMKPEKISKIMQYNDFSTEKAANIPPWELPTKDKNGFMPLEFSFKKPGLYYIQIYISNEPYKSGKASTNGKICASGIIIEVS